MFFRNAKSKAFWQNVQTSPKYESWRNLLLKNFKTYKDTGIEEINFDEFMEFHRTGKRVSFEKNMRLAESA